VTIAATSSLLDRLLRPGATSRRDVVLDVLWLLGLGLLLIGAGFGLRDPWPADEPRFALVAQDMLRSGDWLIPRIGGDLYADKPPLYFWLMAASMAITGSLRLGFLVPSLLSGLGTGARSHLPAPSRCSSLSSSSGRRARRRSMPRCASSRR
jgi:hypothetical protein